MLQQNFTNTSTETKRANSKTTALKSYIELIEEIENNNTPGLTEEEFAIWWNANKHSLKK